MRKHRLVIATGLTLLLGAPAQARPANDLDTRWLPWLGCWQLWEERLERPDSRDDQQDPSAETPIDTRMGRTSVCVVPTGAAIKLTATDGEEVLVERQLIADGTHRDVIDTSCRGWERSEWSRDGHRLFTSSELQCADEPPRRVTGVSLMTSTSSWLDIQYVEMGQYQQLEVRRYSPTLPSETDTMDLAVEFSDIQRARRESTESPNLADVMEASHKTAARVVEALLVETEPDLNLDSQALIALDDAGIDHAVIDLLVALSYPEHFVVERRDRSGAWSSGPRAGFGGFGGFYDPIWYSDLYPYYVTPLGTRYWGRGYDPYFYGGAIGSPFVIFPGGSGGVNPPAARAVRGRGYTRVVPRATSGGAAVRRSGASGASGTSGASGSTGRRTGSSSGGSTATSGGYSGGSSGGSSGTGRTAVPRQ